MSARLALEGLFLDYPVRIVVDDTVAESSVALSFIHRPDVMVPRTIPPGQGAMFQSPVEIVSGPVIVYTQGGFYRSILRMCARSLRGHDIVLGRDWIHACRCRVDNGTVLDAPFGATLAPGHVWVRRDAFVGQSTSSSDSFSSRSSFRVATPYSVGVSSVRDTGPISSGTCTSNGSMMTKFSITKPSSLGPVPSGGPMCMGSSFAGSTSSDNVVSADNALQFVSCSPPSDAVFTDLAVADAPALFDMTLEQLVCNAHAHGISTDSCCGNRALVRGMLLGHISMGECVNCADEPGCRALSARYMYADVQSSLEDRMLQARLSYLRTVAMFMNKVPLRGVLQSQGVVCSTAESKGDLKDKLKVLIRDLRKGKRNATRREDYSRQREENDAARGRQASQVRAQWPGTVPTSLKDKLLRMFREKTSSDVLRTFTCGSCGTSSPNLRREYLPWNDERLNVLATTDDDYGVRYRAMSAFEGTPVENKMLAEEGVDVDGKQVALCRSCMQSIRSGKLPDLALANNLWFGPVPDPLKGLTQVEEALIALCRAKCTILHLKNDGEDEYRALPNMQRSLKGNIIEYPQKPGRLAAVLPPPVEDILTSICVIFVGSNPPSREWLLKKAKPLAVRREKVRRALEWLCQHNPLYKDVRLDLSVIEQLPVDGTLPHDVEFMATTEAVEAAVARYDGTPVHMSSSSSATCTPRGINDEIPFRSVVITDVDANAPSHVLRAAAVRHLKELKGGYVEVPHGPDPMNEFCDPALFPMLYPTLFPYGLGGLEDRSRRRPVSLKRHAAHLLRLSDRRFQQHPCFLFVVFNILQRREVLLRSSFKVKRSSFERVASEFRDVSMSAVASVCERLAKGAWSSKGTLTTEERKVMALMREVNLVTSSLPGSSSARLGMRNQLRGMMVEHGLPSFYLTINPADVYSPVVKFLAGEEIDLDNLTPGDFPDYWEQSVLIAKNPFIGAKFFNLYMNAFIECLLGFDQKKRTFTDEGGVFGHVKAYYGCVEAQGRGSLHCHMVIWLEGALNPNEIRDRVLSGDTDFGQRLIAYLDDCISNAFPGDVDGSSRVGEESRPHACVSRGIDLSLPEDVQRLARREDLRHLVQDCQKHRHSATCWKYCKPGEPKTCRFDLDPSNVCEKSYFDAETGDLCLRCLDGMVNNFNATILEAMRCNMDVKFIGSGEAAKAIMYYVTNYITKPQMKAHVAYATLELAINRLSLQEVGELDQVSYGKRLLRKCAFSLLTEQELSAQQVASYLSGYEDSYSSHEFQNLFWPKFERHVEDALPSPECRLSGAQTQISGDVVVDFGASGGTVFAEQGPVRDAAYEGSGDTSVSDDGTSDDDVDGTELAWDDEMASLDGDDDAVRTAVDAPSSIQVVDDLTVGVDDDGALVVRADQLTDYLHRPVCLSAMSLWDFTRSVHKVKLTRRSSHRDSRPLDAECDDAASDEEVDGGREWDHVEMQRVLGDSGRKRTAVHLPRSHPEWRTKMFRIRHPRDRPVVVPVGPALPRRDRPEVRARYCRLMLVLFKPWRVVQDLRGAADSWELAFEDFSGDCGSVVSARLNNMQLLHECRDSGIDHFRNRAHLRRLRIGSEIQDASGVESDMAGEIDETDMLHHIRAQEASGVLMSIGGTVDAAECVAAALDGGLFRRSPGTATLAEQAEGVYVADECDLERQWQQGYDDRRAYWKQKAKQANALLDSRVGDAGTLVEGYGRDVVQTLASGIDTDSFCYEQESVNVRIVPGQQQSLEALDDEIRKLASKWTLNVEQSRAFEIVARHSDSASADHAQLRMFLGGPGGTGKSRVINALREFFTLRNQARRFRLASFTGIASKNIEGMTLHSALCLNQNTSRCRPGSRTHQDLQAIWEGVDYLFVDEVSMIGCFLMARVSEALCLAKGNSLPFGGVNVIFAGDFAQLPPVGESKLFGRMRARVSGSNGESKGHRSIFGKLLWLSVDTVVLLHQIMRQSGVENKVFVDLLSRLRRGECTKEDYHMLNGRVLDHLPTVGEEWHDVPIIVYDNASKDALNVCAVEAYARAVGKPVHWYYCVDRHKKRELDGTDLRDALYRQPSGKTQQLLGRIPLVIGMKVVVSKNYDVDGGILNGSIGVLRSVRYTVDENGLRHLKSCIVHLPDSSADLVPGLKDKEFPILEETKDWTVIDRRSKRRLVLSRTQVPIQPAYAFTCHRAQGQTFQRVVLDLQSCRGREAPYVMLSRATSLAGVLVLRPFDFHKISTTADPDLDEELLRLKILEKRTLVRYAGLAGEEQGTSSLSHTSGDPSCASVGDMIPADLEARKAMLAQIEDEIRELSETHRSDGERVGRVRYRNRKRSREENQTSRFEKKQRGSEFPRA